MIPIGVSYVYELQPAGSDQWVQIYKWDGRYVYAAGIENSEADIKRRPKEFDDHVVEGSVFANFLELQDGNFLGLATKPGFVQLGGISHGD